MSSAAGLRAHMPFLSHAGVSLRYDRAGGGPPVLLVHGWTANRTFWERQVVALRDRPTVVTVGARGRDEEGDRRRLPRLRARLRAAAVQGPALAAPLLGGRPDAEDPAARGRGLLRRPPSRRSPRGGEEAQSPHRRPARQARRAPAARARRGPGEEDPGREADRLRAERARAAPRRARGVQRGAGEAARSVDGLPDSLPADRPFGSPPGPVDDERLPPDVADRHRTPEARVVALLAVVAHDEDVAGRHGVRGAVRPAAALEAPAGPEEGVRWALGRRVRLAGQEGGVRGVPRLPVHVDLLRANLDRLSFDRDDALHEGAALAVG